MRISTAPSSLPVIVDAEDGVDVACDAVSDRALLRLLDGAATVLAVVPQSTALTSVERSAIKLLEAYRSGALPPEPCTDQVGDLGEDHDRRLAGARAMLEQEGRWLVAGGAERRGRYGPETVAVVALVSEPLAACVVRLRLDDDEATAARAA